MEMAIKSGDQKGVPAEVISGLDKVEEGDRKGKQGC